MKLIKNFLAVLALLVSVGFVQAYAQGIVYTPFYTTEGVIISF